MCQRSESGNSKRRRAKSSKLLKQATRTPGGVELQNVGLWVQFGRFGSVRRLSGGGHGVRFNRFVSLPSFSPCPPFLVFWNSLFYVHGDLLIFEFFSSFSEILG